ncbi:MAG TPA: hypothetical protein VIV66_11580 [Pyrinomonadaceae bacterium]
MKVAFGMKAHSGWAVLVAVGEQDGRSEIVDRRRVELVEHDWEKQPYHAAEDLQKEAARNLVQRGIEVSRRIAVREMRAAVRRERDRRNKVGACAILVGNAMPQWSVEEILAVHLRMHQAEGVLFRDALIRAANKCALKVVMIPEKQLRAHAERMLKTAATVLDKKIAALGKSIGPPWAKDQKDAALAALVALASK